MKGDSTVRGSGGHKKVSGGIKLNGFGRETSVGGPKGQRKRGGKKGTSGLWNFWGCGEEKTKKRGKEKSEYSGPRLVGCGQLGGRVEVRKEACR